MKFKKILAGGLLLAYSVLGVAQNYPSSKFNKIDLLGSGSTGDVSGMSVIAPDSTQSRSLSSIYGGMRSVKSLADVKGDGVQKYVPVTTVSGTATVRCVTCGFSAADIGKVITLEGNGTTTAIFQSVITGYNGAGSYTVTTQDAPTITAGALNTKITWGTDDSAAITAAFSAFRTAGTNPGTMKQESIFFPQGLYIVKQASLNWTNLLNVNIYGYGATFYGMTNGAAVIDMMGNYNTALYGIMIQGNSQLPPTTGIQLGQYGPTNRAYGLSKFEDITMTGYYSLAGLYSMGSETTTYQRVSVNNASDNAYAYIQDGINHFNLQSQYVTMSKPANTAATNTVNNVIQSRFVASGTNSTALWTSAAFGHRYYDSYWYSKTCGIKIFSESDKRTSDFKFNGTMEGPPEYNLCFEGTGVTAITNLEMSNPANNATIASIYIPSSLTTFKFNTSKIELNTLNGLPLFSKTSGVTYHGEVKLGSYSSSLNMPDNTAGVVYNGEGNATVYSSVLPRGYGTGLQISDGILSAVASPTVNATSVASLGGVSSISVTASGAYVIPQGGNNLFPVISIAAPSSGQTASAKVVSMNYNGQGTISSGGTGYVTGDRVRPIGGIVAPGSSAPIVTVTASGGVVTSFTLFSQGLYTSLPASTNMQWETVTGSGSGLVTNGTSFKVPTGTGSVTVTAVGSGYNTAPSVTFTAATGTTTAGNATATSSISSDLTLSGGVVQTSGGIARNCTNQTLNTTYTLASGVSCLRVTNSPTLAASTVTLPTVTTDGYEVIMSTRAGAITSLSFSPAVNGWTNTSTLAAYTGIRLRWDNTTSAWYREQ